MASSMCDTTLPKLNTPEANGQAATALVSRVKKVITCSYSRNFSSTYLFL